MGLGSGGICSTKVTRESNLSEGGHCFGDSGSQMCTLGTWKLCVCQKALNPGRLAMTGQGIEDMHGVQGRAQHP